jgi:C-terminal processing protease CtpA/Prc
LPPGTEVKVREKISGESLGWYQIVSYAYDSGPLEVTGVSAGGAADEAGLQVGDVVLQIDEMDMTATPLNVASGYLRERVGQSVTLVVGRDGGEVVLDVVPRVPAPDGGGSLGVSVKGGLFQGDAGYIGAPALSCD